ncbi:transmembrane protein (plasmid) [Sinorhizobium americanum CCGM7]|uniref:hypothetical protein n=1 Tax=Sinorhizobium americanum TaxID=194963 RepID=UPI0004DA49AD|nr:hypothetical protein [Sinorhizobium americanum]APG87637.1 transmembrane protein [Sinorhizobium americanum CCGM7]
MIVSSATDRLTDILVELPKYKSQWQSNVANPYVRAYDLAVENFQRTLKAQEARDKMTAELFVFAASVLSGSVLMAAFATASLRVLAGRAALRVVCNNNLNRTFDLMHAAASNKAVMFALGGILDEAKKFAGKQITSAAEKLTSSAPIASSPTAINFLTRIEDFINVNHICVHEFIAGVRDDRAISETDKLKVADLVGKTPFCNPPAGRRVDENRLSQKMELLFYMSAVMDSDRLVTFVPPTGGSVPGTARELVLARKPIPQMPSAADYPRETAPRLTGKLLQPFEPGTRIEYSNIGSAVRERIDTLSRQYGGSPFYPQQNFAEKILIDPTGRAQMIRAEQIINRLSADARPKQLVDVRMI